MNTTDNNIVILTLPGTCTGDLWHHAAAQILSASYAKTIVVIALGAISEERDFNESVRRAPAIFDYFRQIGVPCVLARISLPHGGETDFNEKMLDISAHQYNHLMQSQQDSPESFARLWPKLQAMDSNSTSGNQQAQSKALHYFLSTTIVMQYLSLEMSQAERSHRITKLGNLLGGSTTDHYDSEIQQDVDRKIRELSALIASIRASAAPEFAKAQVVLFNWRGPSTYPGHASLPTHFTQITEHAHRYGLLVIRIAAGVSGDEIQDTDFDIFDARGTGNSIRSKRFTPRFWARVARDLGDSVLGLIGGRSGSVDVAAFCGLNCFQWDEPVFNLAAAEPGELEGLELPSKDYVDMQVPQFVRLINQRSILNIGLLEIGSYDRVQQIFLRLEENGLDSWMKGETGIVPHFPRTDRARDLFLKNIRIIENEELGILATNARNWTV